MQHLTIIRFPCVVLDAVISGTACGGIRTIANSPTGELTSPNYPSQYPNNADCQWHIYGSGGDRVELSFVHFNLESG